MERDFYWLRRNGTVETTGNYRGTAWRPVPMDKDRGVTTLGVIFPPDLSPEQLRAVAEAADDAGLEQLWLWEDCFRESGIAAAAAVLAWTDRLAVGIGLLPVPLRNVALTAMELATIERLFPGRFVPGIGHGVLEWMDQVGVRAESPMTLLREYTTALRALLHGGTVTTSGSYVQLTEVALDWPPRAASPILVGAVRPKTLALAGELADGVIFTGEATPESVRESMVHFRAGREQAVEPAKAVVVAFIAVGSDQSPPQLAARIAGYVEAGVTHPILHCVSEDVDLVRFVRLVAQEVRPLVP